MTTKITELADPIQTTGGDARGTAATDLQITRAAVDQVASGDYAVIAGGRDNKCSGTSAVVAGGWNNTVTFVEGAIVGGWLNSVTKNLGFVGGGQANTASGTSYGYNTIGGGLGNTASGEWASILGGRANIASGYYSAILGGFFGLADKYAQQAHANTRFAAVGDSQSSKFVASRLATHSDAAWYTLFLDNIDDLLTIATDTVWTFRAQIVGTTQGCTKSFGFEITGVVENDGGTVTLLASTVTTLYDGDDASFDARALADDANNALLIQVQDADSGGDIVRWVASVQTTEVTFPA
jgi:hypothetical protein